MKNIHYFFKSLGKVCRIRENFVCKQLFSLLKANWKVQVSNIVKSISKYLCRQKSLVNTKESKGSNLNSVLRDFHALVEC